VLYIDRSRPVLNPAVPRRKIWTGEWVIKDRSHENQLPLKSELEEKV